jgi:hypothetical protein
MDSQTDKGNVGGAGESAVVENTNLVKVGNPVMVVGTGRCGTGLVAMLIERMGIWMGKNRRLGIGYEDICFVDLNRFLIKNQLQFDAWQELLLAMKTYRDSKHRRWGFKDPSTAELIRFYATIYPDACFVYCTRNYKDTLQSLMRTYGWPLIQADVFLWARRLVLERFVPRERTYEIAYENLVDNPAHEIEALAEALHLECGEELRDELAGLVVKR